MPLQERAGNVAIAFNRFPVATSTVVSIPAAVSVATQAYLFMIHAMVYNERRSSSIVKLEERERNQNRAQPSEDSEEVLERSTLTPIINDEYLHFSFLLPPPPPPPPRRLILASRVKPLVSGAGGGE